MNPSTIFIKNHNFKYKHLSRLFNWSSCSSNLMDFQRWWEQSNDLLDWKKRSTRIDLNPISLFNDRHHQSLTIEAVFKIFRIDILWFSEKLRIGKKFRTTLNLKNAAKDIWATANEWSWTHQCNNYICTKSTIGGSNGACLLLISTRLGLSKLFSICCLLQSINLSNIKTTSEMLGDVLNSGAEAKILTIELCSPPDRLKLII